MIELPHSQEAEESVIGSVLINPKLFYTLRGNLKPDHFFILKCSYIWQAMSKIADSGNEIELVSLNHELQAMKVFETIGGAAYIAQLIANTPTHVMGEVYAGLVTRLHTRRNIMKAADEIKTLALDESMTTHDVIQKATDKMMTVLSGGNEKEPTFYEAVSAYTDAMLEVWSNPDKTLGIATGHKAIDRHTLGLKNNELIYIIARPGVGKSVVMLQWALNAAKAGHKVGFWSGEMSSDQIIERACASISRIPNSVIRSANLSEYQRKQMTDATVKLADMPIHLWTQAGISPSELKLKVLERQANKGLDILFIDYLGLMRGDDKNTTKYHEVSSISVALKGIANSCNIPVVAGVQLSRGLEQRADKRPQLFDMRDSGSLEQDADIVYGLYRDDMYNDASETPNTIEINQLKNRHGETKCFYGTFDGATSTITETELRKVVMN